MNDYVTFLAGYVSTHTGKAIEDIDIGADIFEAGYIDSLGVFSLMLEIESAFGVKLTAESFSERFSSSISGLAGLIDVYKNKR